MTFEQAKNFGVVNMVPHDPPASPTPAPESLTPRTDAATITEMPDVCAQLETELASAQAEANDCREYGARMQRERDEAREQTKFYDLLSTRLGDEVKKGDDSLAEHKALIEELRNGLIAIKDHADTAGYSKVSSLADGVLHLTPATALARQQEREKENKA